MLFQTGEMSVRELENNDRHYLAKWLSNPEILQYYEGRDNPFDVEKVEKIFFGEDSGATRCIIEFDEVSIGYIQFYEVDEDERRTYGYGDSAEIIYGMDQFIGESIYWNKDLGTELVRAVLKHLIEEKDADRIVMDPQTWNERAIRCYEKCGFKKVKLLPENELHEGEYRDCWLIEYVSKTGMDV